MQIKDSKYHKVWKIETKNGFKKLDLGDGKKDKDGNWSNWTWYNCTLFGNAKSVDIIKGDLVEVKSGMISQRKYNEKWYNDIIIFEIEVMQQAESNNSRQERIVNNDKFEDDIPF